MSKIFVIAGTSREAQTWIAKNYQERVAIGDQQASTNDYKYVAHADDVKGYTNPHGVFVGNWLGRPDILEIVEALMMRSTHVNTALGKIYKDLQPKIRPTPKIVSGYQANIDRAGLLMAQAIDAEVLKNLTQRINGGII